MSNHRYELVRLKNGTFSVRSRDNGETFHPVAGPMAEAEALYVGQLKLRERAATVASITAAGRQDAEMPFIIWDVGLGAGGNVLTAIRALANVSACLEIHSFDRTLDALGFALAHASVLQFPSGFESPIGELLRNRTTEFQHDQLRVRWSVHLDDFPRLVASDGPISGPHAIFYDAFSPRRNPDMWTLPLFEGLFRRLDFERACNLATFSRSTMARTALLLAGFYVGVGESIAGKEETTIAANTLTLIGHPLDREWLERARISQSAEPLRDGNYEQRALSSDTWRRLQAHPQFRVG